MKKYLATFLLFFLLSCQNSELIQRNYPILITLDVKEETSSIITATAEVVESDSKIIEHGFIWGFTSNSVPVDTIFLGPLADTQQLFQYSFKSVFFNKQKYYIMAFVKTDQFIVYGNPINFNCDLCEPATPTIYSFTPTSTREGRSVKIRGINLNIENPEVLYGTSACQINKINETEISITMPTRKRFGSRSQKIYLQQKLIPGSGIESDSFLKLNEPWLWLNEDRILPWFDQYEFAHGNKIYFRTGRNLYYIDYESMETKSVSKVPELYNAIWYSWKYNSNWYVVFSDGVIGGSSYFWEYDILNDSWRRLPDLPTNDYYSLTFAADNAFFFCDSLYGSENLKFNLNDLTWGTHQISMEIFSTAPRFIEVQNNAYAVSNNQLAIFKADTETWEILAEEVVPNGFLYKVGDNLYFGNYDKLFQYSINDKLLVDRTNQITSFPDYNFKTYRIINLETRGLIQFSQEQSTVMWEFDPTYFEN